MKKSIGIIGTGYVGATLGLRLAHLDYQVTFGSRDPSNQKVLDLLEKSSGGAQALSIKETLELSEVIFLAVPWVNAKEVISKLENWDNKIIIDCTNPLKSDLSGLAIDPDTSAAELISSWAKGAHVVKAFNSIGTQVMENPQFGSDKSTLFICGNKDESKAVVGDIGRDLGFEVIDSGDLSSSRYLEQMAMFWIHMAFNQSLGSDFAFKILKR